MYSRQKVAPALSLSLAVNVFVRMSAGVVENTETERYSQRRPATHVFIGQLALCVTSFIMTEILIPSQRL